MNPIIDWIVFVRTSPQGPHYFTVVLATAFMAWFVWKQHFGIAETLSFVLGAYYFHESIYEILYFVSRYLQGIWEPFNVYHILSFTLMGLFVWVFGKRFHLTWKFAPFIALNVIWFAIGYPISYQYDTVMVNLIEEAYTMTFLFGIWGSFR